MCQFHDLLDRCHCAKRIGHMGDCDKLGTLGQALFEFLDMEHALVIHRREDKLRALSLPDEMPGNDIGVMLHDRQEDFIALADIWHAISISDRIDRLSSVLREHNFVDGANVQKTANCFARLFISVCCSIREKMQTAMHICIFICVCMGNSVNDALRLLRRSTIIQINKRLAMNLS